LRQLMHKSNLPFDSVIGTKEGTLYVDKIPFEAGHWQIGRDYQALVAPDGRWVDLQHLLVAVDVLSRKEAPANFKGLSIGSNYAAATWSGDVGSAAAEVTLRLDLTTWERWNPTASEFDRVQHYFSTRASDHDLLGDLDGWGVQRLRERDPTIDKIDTLLASYYEEQSPGGIRSLTTQRRFALERFLDHYGFTYNAETDLSKYPVLPRQIRPASRFVEEIDAFGSIWLARQFWSKNQYYNLLKWANSRTHPRYVPEMTTLLLWWLESQAIENGATVH